MMMRGIGGYLLIGIIAALATGTLTLMGIGLEAGARPVPTNSYIIQHVDRTHKGDRLDVRTIINKRWVPKSHIDMTVGCEPVFSALSSSAHSNNSGRCIA
jgi:hypothetical protein